MSRKYIAQRNNDNFVFPNNKVAEYDVEIIHDLKENSVSGATSNFNLALSGANLVCTFDYTWLLNNAEPYIDNEGKLQILSFHLMTPQKKYFKPWICVGFIDEVTTNITGLTSSASFTITPQMAGTNVFTDGTYYCEIRFIGRRAIFPISVYDIVYYATPTPTPTGTPTPTPGGPTFTPTPTPTPTPTTVSCLCRQGEIVDNNAFFFTDCNGVYFAGGGELGSTFCLDINQPYSSNIQNITEVLGCQCAVTPTPTPTATATPTPTPTEGPHYSFSLGYSLGDGPTACSDYSTSPATYYSYSSSLGNGIQLFTLNTTPLSGEPTAGYYSDGTNYWIMVAGYIYGETSCNAPTNTPTPTPTPVGVGFGIYTGATYASSAAACAAADYPSGTIYLNADNTPNVGDYFYSDLNCTVAFVGNGNFYVVRKDSNLWAIEIGPSGYIYSVVDCNTVPTPTPTPTATLTPTDTPTPTPDPNFYFVADRYECVGGSCSYVETINIANNVDLVINGRYRLDSTNNYIFVVTNTTSPGAYLITTMSGLGTVNCNSLCPTPTPTPTGPPPTDTPTPTPTITDTPTPTPTSTSPTATPTPTVVGYEYLIGPDYVQAQDACDNFSIDALSYVYAAAVNPNAVLQFFDDVNLTSPFAGSTDKHAWARSNDLAVVWVGNVSNTGNTSNKTAC